MNTNRFTVGIVAALALGLGACEKKEAPKPAPPDTTGTRGALEGAARDAGTAVKDATKDAGAAIKGAVDTAKEEAVAAAQTVYDETKNQFEELRSKIAGTSATEKPVLEGLANEVDTHLTTAREKLVAMKDSSADWQKLRDEFNTAMTRVKDGMQSLASRIK